MKSPTTVGTRPRPVEAATPQTPRAGRPRLRIALVLGSLVYVAATVWSYIYIVSPQFSYLSYTYEPPEPALFLASLILAVIPSLWMPVALGRPSQIVYWLLYLLVFVPASTIPFYTLDLETTRLFLFEASLFVAFASLSAVYKIPLLHLPRLQIPAYAFWLIVASLSAVLYAYIISVFGLRFNIVALTDVYDVRFEYRDTVAERGRLVSYAVGWQSYIINPLLIAYGMTSKKLIPLVVGIAGQLMIYSITGFKSVFFAVILILAVWIALRARGKYFGLYAVWGTVGLVLASTLVDLLMRSTLASSFFVRRLIHAPGLLTGYYFEFFSENPKALLGHSILSPFVDYAYNTTPAFLIGRAYFGDPNTRANANVWADAFANFGFWGVFGFTVLLGLVLWAFDSAAKGRDYRLVCLILCIPAFTFCNSALLTSLLNHGIGLAFVLIYLMPKAAGKGAESNGRRVRMRRIASGERVLAPPAMPGREGRAGGG